MYPYRYSEKLKRILKKLCKKDKKTYNAIIRKINEIINSANIEHYKPLRYGLKGFKRVHINSKVLVFEYNRKDDIISFEDFDHHDKIYKGK